MEAYLDICRNVLENGKLKENRTGIDTLVANPTIFQHDMSEGFPLLTTKKTAYNNIRSELEWFISGNTDKQWLENQGNFIWSDWARPSKVPMLPYDARSKEIVKEVLGEKYIGISKDIFDQYNLLLKDVNLRKEFRVSLSDLELLGALSTNREDMRRERDLGPIYGFQWRHFGADYNGIEGTLDDDGNKIDYSGKGVDQLANMVNTLKNNPNDRRMIVSAWNPRDNTDMALPPCHYGFQVNVINNKLNLSWNQRSVDVPLGLPFNISGYATLLHLLAKEGEFEEGVLTGNLMDTHIYVNQIDGIREQLQRTPKDLPRIETENFSSIFDWKYTDTKLKDYDYHPRIKFPIAI
jgi:thymidylate synthase